MRERPVEWRRKISLRGVCSNTKFSTIVYASAASNQQSSSPELYQIPSAAGTPVPRLAATEMASREPTMTEAK